MCRPAPPRRLPCKRSSAKDWSAMQNPCRWRRSAFAEAAMEVKERDRGDDIGVAGCALTVSAHRRSKVQRRSNRRSEAAARVGRAIGGPPTGRSCVAFVHGRSLRGSWLAKSYFLHTVKDQRAPPGITVSRKRKGWGFSARTFVAFRGVSRSRLLA